MHMRRIRFSGASVLPAVRSVQVRGPVGNNLVTGSAWLLEVKAGMAVLPLTSHVCIQMGGQRRGSTGHAPKQHTRGEVALEAVWGLEGAVAGADSAEEGNQEAAHLRCQCCQRCLLTLTVYHPEKWTDAVQ